MPHVAKESEMQAHWKQTKTMHKVVTIMATITGNKFNDTHLTLNNMAFIITESLYLKEGCGSLDCNWL